MVSELLHGLLSLQGWPAYVIVGVLCFGEAAFLLGFVVPGETAVVYGGVLASEHHVSLTGMLVLVVGAAILGDSVGYEVGRYLGPWLMRHRPLKGSKGVAKTTAFLERRGGPAVFFGRFISIFRALMPGMAGISGLRYPTFLLYNALGGLVWGVGFTLAGFLIGKSYQHFLKVAGTATTAVLVVVIAAVIAFVIFRKVREHKSEPAEPEPARGARGEAGPDRDPLAGEQPSTSAPASPPGAKSSDGAPEPSPGPPGTAGSYPGDRSGTAGTPTHKPD